VALIPYGRLALFPLPAVMVSDGATGKRLGDRFEVTLAPSARSYFIARERALKTDHERASQASDLVRKLILAVGNPLPLPFGIRRPGIYKGNLDYAAAEADGMREIARALGYAPDDVVTYIEMSATRTHLLESIARSWYAHLAMHGQFNPVRPRNSRLVLAGDARVPTPERTLTLGECLDGVVSLVGLRLLVLSACETALIDAQQSVNEVVGLAAGFLQAGAASVIATLWPVNDRATFLLMTRFQQLWLDRERNWSPARCLAEAQHWLREEATNAVIATYQPNQRAAEPVTSSDERDVPELAAVRSLRDLSESGDGRDARLTQATALYHVKMTALDSDNPNHLPYADPIFWAAFSVTGA
jgi:CHAT domain-containing protein